MEGQNLSNDDTEIMGESTESTPSITAPHRRKSIRRSIKMPRKSSFQQGNLSATFKFNDLDLKVNQLNINLATEEELMTLPGINRCVAKNIVEHRQAIGRYNKVEDLALVSGIGADRLEKIRSEICVAKRRNLSCASSRTDSVDSLTSNEVSPNGNRPPLDVNTASVFQLMTVRGINQELAAAIVEYRDRRGDFFSLDDLIKVRGMSAVRLSSLRPKLKVMSNLKLTHAKTYRENTAPSNGKTKGLSTVAEGVMIKDIYDIVSSYCVRPIVPEVVLPRNSFRVATWNLTNISKEKASNDAVREVVCLTLLENKISFVAVQGVEDASALQMVCDEFRLPLCKKVKDWKEERGEWKAQFVPIQRDNGLFNLGFMYNSSVVHVKTVKLIQDNSMIRAAEASMVFQGKGLSLLNVHLAASASESSVRTLLATVKSAVILGDFTALKTTESKSCFRGFQPTLSAITCTKTLPDTLVKYHDNIYFRESELNTFSGTSGVVRAGLSHLAIPQGWNWNGPISEHCPVWVQLVMPSVPAH